MKEENKRKRRARVLLLLLPRFAVHPLHGGFVTRTVVRQMKKKTLGSRKCKWAETISRRQSVVY
jgi:hypothetical protein